MVLNMLSKSRAIYFAVATGVLHVAQVGHADEIDAGFQRIVANIKASCRAEHPTSDSEYVNCAERNYSEMHSFFEKFYRTRDTKGADSREFNLGLGCWDLASTGTTASERQTAMEHADWIRVNDCYTKALQKQR